MTWIGSARVLNRVLRSMRFWRAGGRTARLLRDTRGVSAVEFALLSPLLVLGGFATIDAGMAVYEEMMITNTLRSGAQIALSAGSESQIQTIINTVAAENFSLATDTPGADSLTTSVSTYCTCPAGSFAQINCTATCTDASTPLEFYSISATKEFTGILLPPFTLSSNIDILAP